LSNTDKEQLALFQLRSWLADRHGNLIKFKARIVAKGFSQIPGEDFSEIFSSVAKFLTLCIFLSYMAFLDWEVHHVDVVATYLHGLLKEDIYGYTQWC